MPELHQKTHFKAAESLYLGLPGNINSLINFADSPHIDGLVDQPSLPSSVKHSKSDKLPKVRGASKVIGEDATPGSSRQKFSLNFKGIMKDGGKDTTGIEQLDNEEGQKVNGKNLNIDNVNPAEVSKKILLKCNFIKPKPLSVRTLHSGEGHLSMLPEKSVREIYHDVYRKEIAPFSPIKSAFYSP